jgi:hypothetical protein
MSKFLLETAIGASASVNKNFAFAVIVWRKILPVHENMIIVGGSKLTRRF